MLCLCGFRKRLNKEPLGNLQACISAGFFCLKKNVIQNTDLNPIGFKILLEILVKGNYRKVVEIPYIFQRRYAGESKADVHIYLQYNLHLLKLYFYKIKQFFKRLLK